MSLNIGHRCGRCQAASAAEAAGVCTPFLPCARTVPLGRRRAPSTWPLSTRPTRRMHPIHMEIEKGIAPADSDRCRESSRSEQEWAAYNRGEGGEGGDGGEGGESGKTG